MGRTGRGVLAAAVVAVSLGAPAVAGAFGTIVTTRGPFAPQDREHERITRAALACPAGQSSDGTCFEPRSLDSLAGAGGTSGAVGAPDIPKPESPVAHCDNADHIAAARYPLVPRYPTTRRDAVAALRACRAHLRGRFQSGLREAADLLDGERIRRSQVFLTPSCTFAGGLSGRAKCDAYDGFGRALHGIQDFYSHSNWTDARVPRGRVTVVNPPGLGRTDLAPLLDMRRSAMPALPAELMTGCFSIYEKGFSPVDFCRSGFRRVRRTTHERLAKDAGAIDEVTGATGEARTPRGRVNGNFARAVRAAVADTRRAWADFRAELIVRYGPRRGSLIVCALTRDDPVTACQGRKLAVVVDSSGSNVQNDPDDRRVAAAQAFVAGLTSAAEAGTEGIPDRVATVDFDSTARVVSPLGDPDAASFAGIDSSGGTDIAAGVRTAIAQLAADPADPTAGRSGIVVLTDGQDADRRGLIAALDQARQLGIRVSFGFLRPPAAPVAAARAAQSAPAPPADLVDAILATGGVYGDIGSDLAQASFVELVAARGATALDDASGAGAGGPLRSGVRVAARASRARTSYEYAATRGRVLRLTLDGAPATPLSLVVRDVRRGRVVARGRTGADGVLRLRGRLRRTTLLRLDVRAVGAGSVIHGISVQEDGVDLVGGRRADRLRCGAGPTFVAAGAGADRITCGPGDDMLVPGPGRDVVRAGAGDDVVLVERRHRHTGVEVIDAGPGDDLVAFPFRVRGTCRPGRPTRVRSGGAVWLVRNAEVLTFPGRRCPPR